MRLVAASVLVLGLAQAFTLDAVRALLPAICAEVHVLGGDYRVLSLDLGRDGPSSTVRLRANLAHPVYVGHHRILPFGWAPYPRGWYQINLSARGVLQSSLILLIVILGWPSTTVMEFAMRLCLAAPMLAALIMLDAPLELLGNLQEAVARPWDPHGFRPLFAWDRFLEGGGNAVLALAFAACAIAWAAHLAAPAARMQPRRMWVP